MKAKQIEDKIKVIKAINDDIEYLRDEFNGKLWGSRPDGDVKLESIIAFAQENEGILEHIIEFSKKLNEA